MVELITKNLDSNIARSLMLFEANKKSLLIAYVLWFLFGLLGGHRFYSGRTGSALAILAMTIFGFLLSSIGIGFIFLIITIFWVLIDAFLIPHWITNYNNLLALQLSEK